MIKDKQTILADYRDMLKKADRLENQANHLDRIVSNKLSDVQRNLGNSWRGDSASLYQSKVSKLMRDIHSQSNDLRKTAGVIRASATRMYSAEMFALSMFSKE